MTTPAHGATPESNTLTSVRPPASAQPPRTRRVVFFAVSAAVLVALAWLGREVLLPFVLACVVAYVLTPLVAYGERKGVPRVVAILLVYFGVIGTGVGVLGVVTPRVVQELAALRHDLPDIVKRLQEQELPRLQTAVESWLPSGALDPDDDGLDEATQPQLVVRPDGEGFAVQMTGPLSLRPDGDDGYVLAPVDDTETKAFDLERMVADGARRSVDLARHNVGALLRFTQEVVRGISRAIFLFSITLMLAAYLMHTRERVLGYFEGLLRPRQRASFRGLLARIDRGLSGVVRGQLLICLVNGVLSAVGFAIMGLKYWPVLSLVATVFSLIPIFGAILSSIPVVIFALTQSFGTAVAALVWILAIHQIEANFLNPKIMGDAAKIHPVLVVLSLLVGEHLFQLWGALLAVPCLSILLSLFEHFRGIVEAEDPEFVAVEAPPSPVSPPPKV